MPVFQIKPRQFLPSKDLDIEININTIREFWNNPEDWNPPLTPGTFLCESWRLIQGFEGHSLDADGEAFGLSRALPDQVGPADVGLQQVVCLLPLHVPRKPTQRGGRGGRWGGGRRQFTWRSGAHGIFHSIT